MHVHYQISALSSRDGANVPMMQKQRAKLANACSRPFGQLAILLQHGSMQQIALSKSEEATASSASKLVMPQVRFGNRLAVHLLVLFSPLGDIRTKHKIQIISSLSTM